MTDPTPRLFITPRRPCLAEGSENLLEALVRIQAPDADATHARTRLRLNLALVLDRSGSMDGRPLEEAKRSAAMVVRRLRPSDRAAIVVYDQRIDVLVASAEIGDRERFLRAIAGIRSGGQTDLHGGWLAGAGEASRHVAPDVLSRVLLLSDGQANHGLLDGQEIARQVTELAEAGVSTSTYGLGNGFNEDLMAAIAHFGRGLAHYGETADDLREPFETELDLLDAICARNLVLRVYPSPGVGIGVLNDYEILRTGGFVLPDLADGAEAWALVRLRVERPTPPEQALFAAEVAYQDLEGRPYRLSIPPITLPVVSPEEASAAPEEEIVVRRLAEVEAARLQEEARAAVANGDWAGAKAIVARARALAAKSPWVGGVAESLDALVAERDAARFAKEAKLASGRMGRRLASSLEASDLDAREEPSFLRRKRWQGKGER
jgi:Ca-activated chloride channel homolog